MSEVFIKQFHTMPFVDFQVIDENRCPLNLETIGASRVTFTMVRQDRYLTPAIIEAPAEFVNKSKGIVRYRWTEFDTIYPSWNYAWFTIYFPSHVSGGAKAGYIYESVVYETVEVGEAGNNILLVFDGVKTIDEVVDGWNLNNPTSLITHNSINGSTVPNVATIQFTGGADPIVTEQKIAYPDQKEKLEITIEDAFGSSSIMPSPRPPSIEDWLSERRREDFIPVGNKDGTNKTFTTYPYWFTINEAFKIKLKLNGRELTRGVDYNVFSSNTSKLGYNTIVFENEAYIPQSTDEFLADFYISDSI